MTAEAETIQMIITIDNAQGIDNERMAMAINKIYEFATSLFPELLNKMNSPVRVRITRETSKDEGNS